MSSHHNKTVFIWDLDETLILFQSLVTKKHARRYNKNPRMTEDVGLRTENFIFTLADEYFFFRELEDCDQVNINDVKSSNYRSKYFDSDVTKSLNKSSLRKRYKCIEKIYNRCSISLRPLLTSSDYYALLKLRQDLDIVTDEWTTIALKSLMLIHSSPNCLNVLATTTQLVPALAKLMLYGLGGVFNIEDVYSATKIGKESCFERIIQRFGRNATYVAVGDGRDEEQAAKKLGMTFWKVSNHGDLARIHRRLLNESLKKGKTN